MNISHIGNRLSGNINIAFIAIITVLLLCAIGYMVWQTNIATNQAGQPANTNANLNENEAVSPETKRDDIRREQAKDIFATLFARHVLGRAAIEVSQRGLDTLLTAPNGEPIVDPLTKESYRYNQDQSNQKVGELTFKLGSSCDNRIEGSNGKGMIVDATKASAALAIKLEAGDYACASNL